MKGSKIFIMALALSLMIGQPVWAAEYEPLDTEVVEADTEIMESDTEIESDSQIVPTLVSTSLPSDIYLRQAESDTCTLCSATMMLRARMYLSKNSLWSSVTEEDVRKTAWLEDVGLYYSWIYKIDNNSMSVSRTAVSGMTLDQLKTILNSHPEGIVLYVSNVPHAVFVTDYEGDTIYCADPASSYSGEHITLEESYLGTKRGTQENILNNVTSYWYIQSYSIEENLSETTTIFEDVSEDDYYYDAVIWAYENGITTGKDPTHFMPDSTCTRAQVVTFLWRAQGEPEPETAVNPFTDVKNADYYYKAVLWAYENGITTGKDAAHFLPDTTVTRNQFVTFLWRAEGEPAAAIGNPFEDVPDGQYYTTAVLWAYENGITTGKDETHFIPSAGCTRGQVAAFLYRAYH